MRGTQRRMRLSWDAVSGQICQGTEDWHLHGGETRRLSSMTAARRGTNSKYRAPLASFHQASPRAQRHRSRRLPGKLPRRALGTQAPPRQPPPPQVVVPAANCTSRLAGAVTSPAPGSRGRCVPVCLSSRASRASFALPVDDSIGAAIGARCAIDAVEGGCAYTHIVRAGTQGPGRAVGWRMRRLRRSSCAEGRAGVKIEALEEPRRSADGCPVGIQDSIALGPVANSVRL